MSLIAKKWTVSALAVEFKRDRRTVAEVINECNIAPIEVGKTKKKIKYYRITDIAAALYSSKELDLQQERAKLTIEQCKKTEMQNAETEGRLIDRDKVVADWAIVVEAVRSKCLVLPTKNAAQVFDAATIQEVHEILDNAVREILTEIHDTIQYSARGDSE